LCQADANLVIKKECNMCSMLCAMNDSLVNDITPISAESLAEVNGHWVLAQIDK
jgi:hypothetical protein